MAEKNVIERLHRSIIGYSALGILVMSAIIAAVSIFPLYDLLKDNQEQNLTFSTQSRTQTIQEFLSRSKDVAMQITSRTKARKTLEAYNRGELELAKAQKVLRRILGDALSRSDEVLGIARLDIKGLPTAAVGQTIPQTWWFEPSLQEYGAVVRGPFEQDNTQYLLISAPILDNQQKRSGTDLVLYKIENLRKIVQDHSGLGKTGETILVAIDEGQSHSLFPLRDQSTTIEPALNEDIQQALATAEHSGQFNLVHSGSGAEATLLTTGSIEDSAWIIVTRMNEAELYSEIKKQVFSITGLIMFFALLGTSGMVFLLKPLAGKIILRADELEEQVAEKTTALRNELEERKRAEKQLERTNKELDQFSYVVSHDLKAPLRAIHNLSEWIEEDLEDQMNEDSKKNMMLLRLRAKRMSNLITGVLEYSRVGRTAIVPEWVETQDLLKEIIDSQSPAETFQIKIDSSLPALEAPRLLLSQVFANLVSNAIKYHNREDGVVEISCKEDAAFYRFKVTDDGPGIPPEYHEKIFKIFQTVRANKDVDSTGVGLTIVKKIVEEQGGTISLESELGKGTSFRFSWPKTQALLQQKAA